VPVLQQRRKRFVVKLEIGNIGTGNNSTLATLIKDLGKKCFGFTALDKSNIPDILAKI
jgi:hypothetical protein